MKKNIVLTLGLIFLMAGTLLFAQEERHGREVDVIINEIKQNQDVESITWIDPDLIRPDLLEELGDSVMGLMIADEQRHEWMDEMMGGEGSEQLASTHRWVAYNYLQNNGEIGTWGSRMMGPGMMGTWGESRQNRGDQWYGPGSMMGTSGESWRNSSNRENGPWNRTQWYGPGRMMGWSGSWWAWVIGFVVLAVIVLLVVLLIRTRRDGGRRSPDSLEILRRRYAEGGISREEYLQILKELKE